MTNEDLKKLTHRLALASLTQRENKCLWALVMNPGIKQGKIGRLTGLDKSAVSKTIRKLLTKKVVVSTDNTFSLNPVTAEWRELLARTTFPERKPDPVEPKSKVQDPRAYEVAKFFFKKIHEWHPNYKPIGNWLENWAKDIDLLIRVDKKNPDEIRQVITNMVKDTGKGDFCWRRVVMSGAKLRHQFHQLEPRYGKAVKLREWRHYDDNPEALKPLGPKE